MRITVDRVLTAGQIISDLLRRALSTDPKKAGRIRNGVPLFDTVRRGIRADLVLVTQLRDGE